MQNNAFGSNMDRSTKVSDTNTCLFASAASAHKSLFLFIHLLFL